MKVYELKVTLKGSKPPIWRKIAVPLDITFAQLHNVIQLAFGWKNSHLYEFEFGKSGDKITNDKEACEEYKFFNSPQGKKRIKEMGNLPFGIVQNKKTLFAADVKIDSYIKNFPKFKYIYDFGDWWEHSVELISVLEDYTFDYPQVLKIKGICPTEDCGGIDGFYEFMEIWSDKKHPEYDEMHEWAEQQFFSDEYDIDDINEEMENVLDDDFDFMNDLF